MNGWDCSYEELIDRIDGLQEREMMPMSQCGFVLSDGKARIAIDVLVSDMAGSDGRSQRLVPPPFQADDMPLMDGILVTHSHADHLDVPMILSQVRRNPSVQVVAPSSILDGLDIPAGNKAYIGDYGMVSIGGFSITAVPVPHMEYHESAPGHSDFYGYAISFTGLRIGMASMKGISSALSVPLVSVPTLDAISEAASIYPGAVLSVIDARKRKFYLSLKKGDDILIPDCDADPADIIGYLKDEEIPVLITGPDALLFSEKITEIDEAVPFITDPEAPRNISRALITLGLRKYRTSGPDDIGEGPVYIRRSDAEEALERKMKERAENGL